MEHYPSIANGMTHSVYSCVFNVAVSDGEVEGVTSKLEQFRACAVNDDSQRRSLLHPSSLVSVFCRFGTSFGYTLTIYFQDNGWLVPKICQKIRTAIEIGFCRFQYIIPFISVLPIRHLMEPRKSKRQAEMNERTETVRRTQSHDASVSPQSNKTIPE